MGKTILEIILIGAGIFKAERKRYFTNKSKKLLKKIQAVADSPFYKKDMEAKGKAERDLSIEISGLSSEFIKEGSK